MKQKLYGILLAFGVATLAGHVQAASVPPCADEAAKEFGVPVKLFQAMALIEGWGQCDDACKQQKAARGAYGPMQVGGPAVSEMASGLGVSDAQVREDACTNYRAAAWWFVNKSSVGANDQWDALNNFYYGTTKPAKPYRADAVKRAYSKL